MKLKTLKDLIVLCDVCKKYPENNCHHPCCRNHKRVRQEAIKHAKFLGDAIKNGLLEPDKYITLSAETTRLYMHQIAWIKYFSNITDEDLK